MRVPGFPKIEPPVLYTKTGRSVKSFISYVTLVLVVFRFRQLLQETEAFLLLAARQVAKSVHSGLDVANELTRLEETPHLCCCG